MDRKQDLKLENSKMALKKLDKAQAEYDEAVNALLDSGKTYNQINEEYDQLTKELEQMKLLYSKKDDLVTIEQIGTCFRNFI